jgi:hypothetical protein
VTFAYSDPLFCPELGKEIPPSVMDYLDGAHGKDVPKRLHVHVRRVSTSGEREGHPLFSDPETYLQQSFEEKEALLQHFSEHGAYPGGGKEEEVSFTRAYLWLVACYGVVLLSFWVLWKISFWALAIYLGVVTFLIVSVTAKISWSDDIAHDLGSDQYINGKPS